MLLAFLLVLIGPAVSPGPTHTNAPAPPLDACLRAGSFLIQDQVRLFRRPAAGDRFGPIGGIVVLTEPRGRPFVLSIPGGVDVGFGPQPNELGGDLGCVRSSARWRTGSFSVGLTRIDPAKGTLKGDRITTRVCQEGRTGTFAGRHVRSRGTLAALAGKDRQGLTGQGSHDAEESRA